MYHGRCDLFFLLSWWFSRFKSSVIGPRATFKWVPLGPFDCIRSCQLKPWTWYWLMHFKVYLKMHHAFYFRSSFTIGHHREWINDVCTAVEFNSQHLPQFPSCVKKKNNLIAKINCILPKHWFNTGLMQQLAEPQTYRSISKNCPISVVLYSYS